MLSGGPATGKGTQRKETEMGTESLFPVVWLITIGVKTWIGLSKLATPKTQLESYHNFRQLRSTHSPSIITGKIIYLVPSQTKFVVTKHIRTMRKIIIFLKNHFSPTISMTFKLSHSAMAIFSQTTLGKEI